MSAAISRPGANAQAYTPPPPPLTTGPCVPTKEFPCDNPKQVALPPGPPPASEKFPFPGETPATPAPGQTTAKPTPAQQFPFPGETSDTAATPAPGSNAPVAPATGAASKFPFPGEPPDPPSSSSSSSSSSSEDAGSSSSDQPSLKDAGSSGSTRFERRKLAVPEDLSKRELDDLDVSHFYITTGDFLGAYMRAQDAVKLYPDDENAHLALAIAAEKMKKKDEAVAEYKQYLKLAPDGDKAKQAHRALETLGGK